MKILEEGILPEDSYKIHDAVCWNCGCQVQYNPWETLIKQRISPHSYTVSWKYILCPTLGCGKDIILR